MRVAFAAIALVLLPELMSGAQLAPGKYKVYGHGMQTCGTWSSVTREAIGTASFEDRLLRLSWLVGFVSGAGFAGHQLAETDSNAMERWIDNYCQQNPLDSIATAAQSLVKELEKRR